MRRKLCYLLAVAFISLTFVSNIKAQDPQDMGKLTVKLLKSFDSWDDAFYDKNMVSVNDVLQKVMKMDLKAMTPERMAEADRKWRKDLHKRIEAFTDEAANVDINWKKIKFVDFSYKKDMPGVDDVYKGDLVFSYKKKKYSLDVGYMITDRGLLLGNLEDLIVEE